MVSDPRREIELSCCMNNFTSGYFTSKIRRKSAATAAGDICYAHTP